MNGFGKIERTKINIEFFKFKYAQNFNYQDEKSFSTGGLIATFTLDLLSRMRDISSMH